MRRAAPFTFTWVLLAAMIIAPLRGATTSATELENPYDYAARHRVANESLAKKDYSTMLYHTAWLAWLAPQSFATPAEKALRDRDVRDRVLHLTLSGTPKIIFADMEARRSLNNSCANGTVNSQRTRLQAMMTEALQNAEEEQARLTSVDPVARYAVADLYLLLDDTMRFAGKPERERKPILRRALTSAEAVVRALPNAPGGYQLSAVTWARLAELSNDAQDWNVAITACAHALSPDPDNPALWELMWTLHLRAGHWEEAKRWQRKMEEKQKVEKGD